MTPQRLSGSRIAIIAGVGSFLAFAFLATAYRSSTVQQIHVPDGKGAVARVEVALPDNFYNHSVVDFYQPYRDHMFAPWTCLDESAAPDSRCRRPITARAITALEFLASGGAYRIRYTGKDILYRPLQVFRLTYKVQRLEWIMNTIREMADEGLLTRTVNGVQEPIRFDAVFRTGDSPQITKDTLSKDSGYLLFSLRSSNLHFDIPIPDPVGYGSNGNYVWPDRSTLVPWAEKVDKAVFRGSASFNFGVDNWHSNARFRAVQFSNSHPDLLDIGMTALHPKPVPPLTAKPEERDKGFFPQPTVQEILNSAGIELAKPMTFYEQSQYKYILDIDGGLGSSRRIAMLQTGSVPLLTESNWFCTHNKLLVPWVHYVPIAEDFSDLLDKVRWLRDNDDYARSIVEHASAFADAYLTKQAAKEQFAAILSRYADLQAPDVKLDHSEVEVDFCKGKPSG
ncbi:hypothetical protein JCM3774_001636 [Rhodotorula dairenensis]